MARASAAVRSSEVRARRLAWVRSSVQRLFECDVDDVAALSDIHAGLAGFDCGRPEALFCEGAEAAGGLELEDAGSALHLEVSERDGCGIFDGFEDDRCGWDGELRSGQWC